MIKKFIAALSAVVMMITAVPQVSAVASVVTDDTEPVMAVVPVNDVAETVWLSSEDVPTEPEDAVALGVAFLQQQFTMAQAGVAASTFERVTSAYISNEAFDVFSNPDGARLFYSRLFQAAKNVYYSTEDLVRNSDIGNNYVFTVRFSDCGITKNEAQAVFAMLRASCPLTYFFALSVWYNSTTLYPVILEEYASADARAGVRTLVDNYIASLSEAGSQKSKYHTAKYLHDHLVNKLSYAYKSDGVTPESAGWAHSIIGPLTQNKGVCEAYSRTYEMLLNYYGGEAMYVYGNANGGSGYGAHAWNIVLLDDGKYYYVDTTFDDPVVKDVNGNIIEDHPMYYTYFAKGTSGYANTHLIAATDDLTASGINPLNYQFAPPTIPAAEFSTAWLENYLNHTHKYVSAVTTPATCTTKGVMTYTCSICGDSYTREIPLAEHDYRAVKNVLSTCTVQGYTVYICNDCGDEMHGDFQSLNPHPYVTEITKQPTCTEDGICTFTCPDCGQTIEQTVTHLGHDLHEDRTVRSTCKEQGYTVFKCSREGCVYEEKRNYKPLSGHSYTYEITVRPTCKKTGEKKYTCTVCGDSYIEELPIAEHNFKLSETVNPTCTQQGYSVYVCSDCGTTDIRDYTDPTGHTLIHCPEKPADCENGGTEEYWMCEDCGLLFADSEALSIIEEPTPIPPLGHDYKFAERVEPTYDEDGYELYVCSRNSTHIRRDVLDAKERNIAKAELVLYGSFFKYTGNPIIPDSELKVYFDGNLLAKGVDYELSYSGNTDVGINTAKITVVGMGKFVGTASVTFSIIPERNSISSLFQNGNSVAVAWNEEPSALGYEVQYSRDPLFISRETVTVTVLDKTELTVDKAAGAGDTLYLRVRSFTSSDGTLKGDRIGLWSPAREITLRGSLGKISMYRSYLTYTGSELCPLPEVTDANGKRLKNGVDYVLTYINNKDVGTAAVKAVGIGNYSGTLLTNFVIAPPGLSLLSARSGVNGTVSVTTGSCDSSADGIEILVASDKNFTDVVRTVVVYGTSRRTFNVSGLASGVYYVKVRAFKRSAISQERCGEYSGTATVRVN